MSPLTRNRNVTPMAGVYRPMGELRMSGKERIALDAMGRVKRKELTVVAAAELMGLSVRQARRVWKRFRAEGDRPVESRLSDDRSGRA